VDFAITRNTRFWSFGNKEVYSPMNRTELLKTDQCKLSRYSIVKKYAKKAASIERYLENK